MIRPTTFRAWRVADQRREAIPVALGDMADLGSVVAAAAGACFHKQSFIIEESDAVARRNTLHFYRVRQKAGEWRRNPETGITEKWRPLYAEHQFSLDVTAFAPVEPWRWTPGADPVGHDFTLIEGEAA